MTIKELFGHAKGVVRYFDLSKFYAWFMRENHTFKGDITFEGSVDLSEADVIEYTSFASEEDAIDAGLLPGDKFLLNGVETTVTNIKQTFTLGANAVEAIGFLVDMTDVTPDDFYANYIGEGTFTMAARENGVATLFDSTFIPFPGINTITAFKIGSGYFMSSSVAKTVTVYGKPINPTYKRNITANTNNIAWVDETVDSATALAFFNGTKSGLTTRIAGATVNDPATFIKGRAYQFGTDEASAEQGLPKLAGVGDPTVDAAFATEAAAISGGVIVGQVWFNTTSKRLLTRMS
jgi:hypothetical protein